MLQFSNPNVTHGFSKEVVLTTLNFGKAVKGNDNDNDQMVLMIMKKLL